MEQTDTAEKKEQEVMEGYRWRAAVVTLSDKGYASEREDRSGPLICEMIEAAGYNVEKTILLPDEKEEIKKQWEQLSLEFKEWD